MENPLTHLHQFIVKRYDLGELRTLCFDLSVNYDALPGKGTSSKARELLLYLGRRRQLDELLDKLHQDRTRSFDSAGLSTDPTALYAALPVFETGETYTPPVPTGPCPYRGLLAFREQDAPFFFGRETFTERLVEAVHTRALPTVVVGPSGSGKSSVVFAGLLPRLRQADASRPPGDSWAIAQLRPGSQPFHELANALLPLLEPQMTETDRLIEIPKAAKAFQQGELALRHMVERILQKNPETSRLLLIMDQFEELYTLSPNPATRQAFLDLLLQTIPQSPDHPVTPSPLHLILTLRADFLGQVLSYRPFADALDQAQKLLLGPMTRDELQAAISRPAERQGVTFEDGLLARILDDVGDEPGNLPLLEFALTQLWERQEGGRLTHAAYEAVGKVEGALTLHADQVYKGLGETEREQARRVFVQLVRPGEGTEDTRRRATRAELGEADWTLVQRLADARLVVTDRDPAGQDVVEVAHEMLIRGWGRLRAWMDEDRDFRVWQEHLRAALRQWQTSGRDTGALLRSVPLAEAEKWLSERSGELSADERTFIETSQKSQHKATLLRFGAIGTVIVLLLAILGIGWFSQYQITQEQQKRVADQATAVVEIQAERDAAHYAEGTAEAAASTEAEARQEAVEQAATAQAAGLAESEARQEANEQAAAAQAAAADETKARLEAERRKQIALAQSLAALAPNTNDDELTTLLAVESLNILNESSESVGWLIDRALRDVLSKPYFSNILNDHKDWVKSVAFSPDGRWLASSSISNTIQVWNMNDLSASPCALSGNGPVVLSVAFSPDGRWLASGSVEGIVQVWDMESVEKDVNDAAPRVLSGNGLEVWSVAFSPDGRWLASSGEDGTVHVWDIESVEKDVNDAIPRVLSGHEDVVKSVAFSPNGRWLASGSRDDTVRVWDMNNLSAPPHVLNGHEDQVMSVTFSSDGRWLASGSGDQMVRVWDMNNLWVPPHVLNGHESMVMSVAFSPDGWWLASGSDDRTVRLWDISALINTNMESIESKEPSNAMPHVLNGHEDEVTSVAFSPNGWWLASGSDDCTVRVWNVSALLNIGMESVKKDANDAAPRVLNSHEDVVSSVAFSPDGRWLTSGSHDHMVRVWDISDLLNTGIESVEKDANDAAPHIFSGHKSGVLSVAFSPDCVSLPDASAQGCEQWLASSSDNGMVRVWDVSALLNIDMTSIENDVPNAASRMISGHEDQVRSVAFSPGGQWLASGSDDHTVRVWDISALLNTDTESVENDASNAASHVLSGHVYEVLSVAFSPDGRWLASGSGDRTIRVWDVENLDAVPRVLNGHEDWVGSVAFSPDGQWLASGSDDRTVRVWDMENLDAAPRVLNGHEDWVRSVAFSPDEQWLASGSDDGTVRVWDVENLDAASRVLNGHEDEVTSVAFSPDGQWLASGSDDGTVRVWIVRLEELAEIGCQKVYRNMTHEEWNRYLPGEPYRATCPNLPIPAE